MQVLTNQPISAELQPWLDALCTQLAVVKRYEELEAVRVVEPWLGLECARRLRLDPRPDAIQEVLALRAQVDRMQNLRGHRKRSKTYSWARSAAQTLDALLRDRGAVYLSPKQSKFPFDAAHAGQLLLHGHTSAVADWANASLLRAEKRAHKAKKWRKSHLTEAARRRQQRRSPSPPALLIRACIDLLRDDPTAALRRLREDCICARKHRNPRESLVLTAIAHALLGQADSAVEGQREIEAFSAEMRGSRVIEHTAIGPILEAHVRKRFEEAGKAELADLLFSATEHQRIVRA